MQDFHPLMPEDYFPLEILRNVCKPGGPTDLPFKALTKFDSRPVEEP